MLGLRVEGLLADWDREADIAGLSHDLAHVLECDHVAVPREKSVCCLLMQQKSSDRLQHLGAELGARRLTWRMRLPGGRLHTCTPNGFLAGCLNENRRDPP